jgi:hypothetical protein
MSNMASKLKPIDADLELKPALLVHLVMASFPKEFDNFVINYNTLLQKPLVTGSFCLSATGKPPITGMLSLVLSY